MKKITLFLVSLVFAGALWAQNVQVSGVVTDTERQTMPGVSVVVKGTRASATTDVNGRYTISAPADAVLVFSFLGMKEHEEAIGGRTAISITMEPASVILEEVVVTAMGISRSEKSIGYAATSVDGESIAKLRSPDLLSGLSGKVAGVQVSTTGSDPGASNSVIIRGVSSLSGNNQPLFVVDGVPIQNNATELTGRQQYTMGNAANLVSPDNIQNMTILKGAAATALYGSRAANGVILITTKAGQKNQPLSIELNSGVQFSTVSVLPEFQNSFGQGWYGLKTHDENGSWGPAFDGRGRVYGPVYPVDNSQLMKKYVALPDNVRDFFESGVMYSNSISLSGGGSNTTYHAAFSNVNDNGIMPGKKDKNNVTTMSFNGAYSYKDWLDISSAVNIANQNTSAVYTGQGTTVIDGVYELPRDISIVDLKDLSNPFNTPAYYFTPYGITNPYYALEHNLAEFKQNKVYGKFQADLKPFDFLKFTYRLGYDYSDTERKQAAPKLDLTGTPNAGINQEGNVSVSFARRYELNHDFFGVYTDNFFDEQLNLTATLGLNVNERGASSLGASNTNLSIPTFFDLSNASAVPTVSEALSKRRLMGVFGDVQLGYKNMVYLGLTMRNDWSSTLPVDNNAYFYPGLTASFIFTELLPKNDILSFGKVRAAWGRTGNDAGVYLINPGFVSGYARNAYSATTDFPIGGLNAYKLANTLGSTTLQPEMTSEMEFGVNLQFFTGRIGLDAAYYNRTSDKQIFALNMDPATGFTAQTTNLGKISNKGVEILLTTVPVKMQNFTWTLDFTFSKNISKVESLPEELGGFINLNSFTTVENAVYMRAEVGQPVGTFWTLNTLKDDKGNVVVDAKNGRPIATPEVQATGYDINSDWEGGISTSFSAYGVTLGANLDIRVGGYMFSRTKDLMAFTGNGEATMYNNRYTYIIPGSVNQILDAEGKVTGYKENTTPITSQNVANGQYTLANGFDGDMSNSMLKRDFVKLRNVTLSYDLPTKWVSKIQLKGVRLSLVGSNLFVWTPKENIFIDPELTTNGSDLYGKFGELYANPSTRRYGFNIQIRF